MNIWKLLLYKIDTMEAKILPILDGNAVMAYILTGPIFTRIYEMSFEFFLIFFCARCL